MLEITESNGKFATSAADLIQLKGHTIAKYEDRDTGACCALGAFRILIFGRAADLYTRGEPESKVNRYFDLVEWFAKELRARGEQIGSMNHLDGETVIGTWNDFAGTEHVLAKLREIGGADVLAVPQA